MIKVSKASVGEEEISAMRPALLRGYYGHAENVVAFEKAIAEYIGVEPWQVVCVNTGTSALHLAVEVCGIDSGDEVISPSLTFVACFQAITAAGAIPVACDIDGSTLQMSLEDAESRITEKTRAIIPVHYTGCPVEMDKFLDFAKKHNLRLIEDAAHAFGSTYKGKKIGSFGDLTCFSFDSIKNITCGEGGAVICRNKDDAEKLRQMRLLGIDRDNPHVGGHQRTKLFDVKIQGWRYHMSNLNAAIGLEQIKKVESFINRRQLISQRYVNAFSSLPGLKILPIDYSETAPHIFVIRVLNDKRDQLTEFLKDRDIETAFNYIPNHLLTKFRSGPFPNTDMIFKEILTIPLHCSLTEEEVDFVIKSIVEFFN